MLSASSAHPQARTQSGPIPVRAGEAHKGRRLAPAALILLWLTGGCAGADKRTLDEAFRRIQVHEAAIAAGEAKLARSEKRTQRPKPAPGAAPAENSAPAQGDKPAPGKAPCPSAKQLANDVICQQSKGLCAIARELEDTDARRRCLIGSDTCRSAQARAEAICARPAAP